MAYVAKTSKLKKMNDLDDPGADPQAVGGQPPISTAPSGGFIQGSGGGGGNIGTVGSGAGGAWTNIQNYMSANQGDTASASYFSDKAQDAFGMDREKAKSEAEKKKQEANRQLEESTIGQDQASKLINQAGQNYSYGGQANDAYSQATGQLRDAYSAKYQGPTQFNYALSNQAQNYGSVGDDQAFQGIMNRLYNDRAGGQMNAGTMALQRQLDSSNPALEQARQNVVADYGQLNQDIEGLAQDTTQELGGVQDLFLDRQRELKDFLRQRADAENQARLQAEADAKAAYRDTFSGDKTGIGSFDTRYMPRAAVEDADKIYDMNDVGPDGSNLTYKDLQSEFDEIFNYLNPSSGRKKRFYSPNDYYSDEDKAFYEDRGVVFPGDYLTDAESRLEDFYKDQREQYYNTGDAEKRRYNTIQDVLGNQGKTLDEGFFVTEGPDYDWFDI